MNLADFRATGRKQLTKLVVKTNLSKGILETQEGTSISTIHKQELRGICNIPRNSQQGGLLKIGGTFKQARLLKIPKMIILGYIELKQ